MNVYFLLKAYASLRQLAKLSKLKIPEQLINDLEPIKDNDDAIRKYGVNYAIAMCQKLLSSGEVTLSLNLKYFHMSTLTWVQRMAYLVMDRISIYVS